MKQSVRSKRIVQNQWPVFFSVTLTVLALLLVFYEDATRFSPSTKTVPGMTEGQKEMLKRAEKIREVLDQGKLELTPGRYYRKWQESQP
jgi:hypothetical protein